MKINTDNLEIKPDILPNLMLFYCYIYKCYLYQQSGKKWRKSLHFLGVKTEVLAKYFGVTHQAIDQKERLEILKLFENRKFMQLAEEAYFFVLNQGNNGMKYYCNNPRFNALSHIDLGEIDTRYDTDSSSSIS